MTKTSDAVVTLGVNRRSMVASLGSSPASSPSSICDREVDLHAAIACQGEQADHGVRRVAHRTDGGEGVPSARVSSAWQQYGT